MDTSGAHATDSLLVYVGSYTQKGGPGITALSLDLSSGTLSPASATAPASVSPSFLAFSPNHRFLYAVNEVDDYPGPGGKGGAATAFSIDSTGSLTALGQQSTVGGGPCHVALDRSGRYLAAANYGTGSVCVLPVHSDGSLGAACSFVQHHGSSVDASRQEGPHAHCVAFDPSGKRLYVCDLGLDEVLIYDLDPATGKLTPNEPAFGRVAPGGGPRHIAFHPNGHTAYVINEMGSSITVFDYDAATGALTQAQTLSTLPDGWHGGNTCAEVVVSPDGRFVYGSNRGADNIAVFAVDKGTGHLKLVGYQSTGGKTPRNFAIEPSGRYLLAANQDSDSVVAFSIDRKTGLLKPTGGTAQVSMPVCIVFR